MGTRGGAAPGVRGGKAEGFGAGVLGTTQQGLGDGLGKSICELGAFLLPGLQDRAHPAQVVQHRGAWGDVSCPPGAKALLFHPPLRSKIQ